MPVQHVYCMFIAVQMARQLTLVVSDVKNVLLLVDLHVM